MLKGVAEQAEFHSDKTGNSRPAQVRLIAGHADEFRIFTIIDTNEQKLLSSNLGRNADYPEDFCGFSVTLEKHSEKVSH